MIKTKGSVRVDLLGGTLDLNPIHLILPDVVTLNVATSLCAEVGLEKTDRSGVEFESLDFDLKSFYDASEFNEFNLRGDHFGPLTFMAHILHHLGATSNLKVTLKSGSPAGAGLGGSSAMGVTLFSAVKKYQGVEIDANEKYHAIKTVQDIEAKILDSGPAGYQDYFPALFGGILALKPSFGGIQVEQLFSAERKKLLEDHLTLVYTGETRHSGINNWEVYKGFFDKKKEMREGLREIAELSSKAYKSLKKFDSSSNEDAKIFEYMTQEGSVRGELFPGILSPSMQSLYNKLVKTHPDVGLKVCGAGGGGCFLLIHKPDEKADILSAVEKEGMRVLNFAIEPPLN